MVVSRNDSGDGSAVFYELLTGQLPFKGDHEAAIIYGIMHNDPEPLQMHRDDIPEGLQHVIHKALARNVDERCQSALEFKSAISELWMQTGVSEGAPARSTKTGTHLPFRRVMPWVVLGGVVLAIVLFIIKNGMSPSSDRSSSISATYTQLTFTGDARDPIVSPDGQFVAYFRAENKKQILVRDIGGGEPVVVFEGFDACYSLRWSPDGARLLAALCTLALRTVVMRSGQANAG